MSLESVLVILFISPFVLGILAALFDGSTVTPIVIDYRDFRPEATISKDISEGEEEFLFQVASEVQVEMENEPRLEESPEALDILKKIEKTEEAKPLEFVASDIPEGLNKSLDELFKAIDGGKAESQMIHEGPQESTDTPAGHDLLEEMAPAVLNPDEFEASLPSIDEMLDQMSSDKSGAKIYNPYGEHPILPPREYRALLRKYGDVVNKVTTTPGIGGTGDYDCMIGRVVQFHNENMTLQYGNHHIPLKGMTNLNGVYLVEGMFIKPDLFFVSNYTKLAEKVNAIVQVAE